MSEYALDIEEEWAEFFAVKDKIARDAASGSEAQRFVDLTLKALTPKNPRLYWQIVSPPGPAKKKE